jgi:hypothetical protein
LWLWHFRLSLNLTMPAFVPMAAGFRTDNRERYDAYGNSNGDTSAASRLRIVDRNNRQARGDCQYDKRLCSLLEHFLTPPRAPISTRGRGRIGGEDLMVTPSGSRRRALAMAGEHPSQATHTGDDLKPPIAGNPIDHEPRCSRSAQPQALSPFESVRICTQI